MIKLYIVLFALACLAAAASVQLTRRNRMDSQSSNENIRPSAVAGRFYSASPSRLRQEIQSLLDSAPDCPKYEGQIVSAAVPHAGYVYSAAIAAPVYKAIKDVAFDTVVIIGHDFGRQAPGIIAVLPDFTAFHTPLGDVPVDTELCKALWDGDRRIIRNNRVHSMEHSIEVQLPFLQVTHTSFSIVPVLFGEVTPEHIERFASLLMKNAGNRRIFVLSSTDFSHYPKMETSKRLDAITASFAEKLDMKGLCAWQSHGEWEKEPGVETPICSAGGLCTAMQWAKLHGETRTIVLKRGNSGDVSGDGASVVGYTSMVFASNGAKKASDEKAEGKDAFAISLQSQKLLLTLARNVIQEKCKGGHYKSQRPDILELSEPAAVFVTLHKLGKLRGCIGTIQARSPLYDAVVEYAELAAFDDPRFQPVTSEELKDIKIEISVLSPMRKISSPSEIIPGKHGVVVSKGRRRGLFLPQVWEQLPDMEQFMGYLCAEKAGLPFDAWKGDDVELLVFTVHAFEEK